MTPDSEAASPAPQPIGDGKKTAANVTAEQAIARFVKQSEQSSEPAQTADTKAPPPQGEATAEPAAEPAQADSPDAPAAPETEATAEAPGEAEADAVLSPENSTLDPKTKEKIQRRIDKEVGKRKALEAQLEAVQREIASIKQAPQTQAPSTPPANDPLPEIKDQSAIADYKKQAKSALREAEAILENDEIDWSQGYRVGDKVLTKAEIRKIRQDARVALEDTIPAKEDFLRQQEQHVKVRREAQESAKKAFPWLTDQSSERFKLAAQAWEAIPSIRTLPNSEYIVGLLALGQELLQKEQTPAKPQAAPAAPKPAAPKQKAPSDQAAATTVGAVPRVNSDSATRSALAAEMDKLKAKRGATTEDAVSLLMKRDAARRG